MPEIGEVARIVHYIRKHLVGRTITTCIAHPDDIVYGKVGCSAEAFQQHVSGRRIVGADRQGKYFYMLFDKPPHAVCHFGMTGWMKFDVEETGYYKKAVVVEDGEREKEEWPPKYVKFLLKCGEESVGGVAREAVEAAFVDPRRLARIRLVDCAAEEIRKASPLKENGPDPVRDREVVTVEWLGALLRRKRVPVKALLLDQANLSGVGNWVADEVMYQATLHPEQYSNTFDDGQVERLHKALMDVCTLAVETNADSSQFPDTWLMKYRWDKGKKDSNVLPSGEKIVHLKVGGRTSAIVPSVQKKTAAVAGDVDSDEPGKGPAKGRKRKARAKADAEEDDEEDEVEEKVVVKKGRVEKKSKAEPAGDDNEAKPSARKARSSKKAGANGIKDENDDAQVNGGAEDERGETETTPPPTKAVKGRKAASKKSGSKAAGKAATPGSRKSSRAKSS
ncbi:hypothetical protein LTR91_016348 [Friedmanniomyces endolithicus]|uniref:Formamidopyrimidine-DNA glycosylase catalytic domain-containing protein n=1 Tax=Friedmanniomyces endolithicus TaxID=329885 RepID=A0AAN6QLZ4_9PEZI|nr:hypothetical protein LTR94_020532 [Friedmanniomyces endolithicus]KAK0784528.1 hypothetical protein LTR59_011358 [Friedmanniomyces endolithicus]KAK0790138.1 hypothetical protein LTR38_010680 [Friedmanniomyces endolithicus]KAK0795031.1 hypothetical protein LTR75_010680 [Friedmanniomyces endolithicus]KAK0859064.1 hypothetical protein LTS02_009521 [Friedmanniomyces endolithicus]